MIYDKDHIYETYKGPRQNKIELKPPSLNGNKSELGA